MTNEQQAVYLRGVATQLGAAIDDARAQMPPDAEREMVRIYKGDRDEFSRVWDHENWVQEPVGEYVALLPLVAVLEHITEDAALLLGKEGEA